MKKYTVVWSIEADAQLARIWSESKRRSMIQRDCDQLERLLGNTPYQGNEFSETHRTASIELFEILYVILEEDRIVRVIAVKEH